jgi:predicted HicB family RNase H-like nuclease
VVLVHVLVEPALMEQVQEAAAGHGASVAAWVRCALRQVTLQDFPASWRTEEVAPRSHESGYYHRKFGLRLDDETSRKLAVLTTTFHRSGADVIRQLIVQATPKGFPPSWHGAANVWKGACDEMG